MTDEELTWLRRSRRSGPQLPLFDVRLDEMEHPQSGDVLSRLVLSSVDWVNMVALTETGESVMVRQFVPSALIWMSTVALTDPVPVTVAVKDFRPTGNCTAS